VIIFESKLFIVTNKYVSHFLKSCKLCQFVVKMHKSGLGMASPLQINAMFKSIVIIIIIIIIIIMISDRAEAEACYARAIGIGSA
jgi:hypothetical protein